MLVTDVGDGMLVTVFGDGFYHFGHQHQDRNSVTDIQNCHYHKVTSMTVSPECFRRKLFVLVMVKNVDTNFILDARKIALVI